MSVAYDFSVADSVPAFGPEPHVPAPVAPRSPSGSRGRLATVSVLHAPLDIAEPTWRLTRRGQLVIAVLVALLGAALMWAASSSAPRTAPATGGPAVVTVHSGDTLWSIASQIAPQTDPRSEIALLQARNHLSGVDLVPGQVLRVR